MQVNRIIAKRDFLNIVSKNKTVILDEPLVQGNYHRRNCLVTHSPCKAHLAAHSTRLTTRSTRSTCFPTCSIHFSTRSTFFFTRGTRLAIRLSIRGTCLFTCSTRLSTASTRSTIVGLVITTDHIIARNKEFQFT